MLVTTVAAVAAVKLEDEAAAAAKEQERADAAADVAKQDADAKEAAAVAAADADEAAAAKQQVSTQLVSPCCNLSLHSTHVSAVHMQSAMLAACSERLLVFYRLPRKQRRLPNRSKRRSHLLLTPSGKWARIVTRLR